MSEFANGFKDIFIKYKFAKHDFFKWRSVSKLVNKLVLALGFACLTGLLAQLRFYLPYTRYRSQARFLRFSFQESFWKMARLQVFELRDLRCHRIQLWKSQEIKRMHAGGKNLKHMMKSK